jgi:tetratricopeptide (TPR) repeat protein
MNGPPEAHKGKMDNTTNAVSPSARRSRLPQLIGLLLLGGGILAIQQLAHAWAETRLREAYLPDLKQAVQHQPHDGPALVLLGVRLCEARQFAAALPYFRRAAEAGENNPDFWLTWSAAAAASGDRAASWEVLRVAKSQPGMDTTVHAAAERCRALPPNPTPEQLGEAIAPQSLRPALARYAGGSFLNGLSLWYGRQHLADSGFTTREKLAQEQPQNAQFQDLWGEALLRNERPIEAVPVLQRALQLDPNLLAARLHLGDALYAGGAGAKAALEYLACLKAKPNWEPALLGLGHVAVDKKLIAMAIQIYEEAVKQDPKSADAWIGIGRAYLNQRLNLSRALLGFQTAAKLAPDRTDFYGEYSDALRVNYRADEAEALLRTRLTVAPEEARTHYLLATTLLTNNPTPERLKAAEDELRVALRLEPAGYASAVELGKLLVQEDRAAEAVPLLETALRADPRNVAALNALSRAYKKVGRTREAEAVANSLAAQTQYVNRLNMLEEQVERKPGDAKLHHQLAALYAEGGDTEKATILEQEAVALERHGAKAAQAIDVLRRATNATTPLSERPTVKTP